MRQGKSLDLEQAVLGCCGVSRSQSSWLSHGRRTKKPEYIPREHRERRDAIAHVSWRLTPESWNPKQAGRQGKRDQAPLTGQSLKPATHGPRVADRRFFHFMPRTAEENPRSDRKGNSAMQTLHHLLGRRTNRPAAVGSREPASAPPARPRPDSQVAQPSQIPSDRQRGGAHVDVTSAG
jgi:hypothetical protein